jgi:hypothetical protein
VRLVKTVESAANRHQILDCRHVPFDPGLDPQNLLFPQFLRNTLASFGGPTDSASIWATISSARLDTRLLRIPKVARRQIPNAVIWAYQKKNPYNDKQRLFDFEVLGETTEGDTPQIEVLAYTIPREDIDSIKTAFTRAGYTLDGVSTYPFLLQNLLRTRWKILSQGNLCALYIGRNWSRIDLFNNGTLMLSRGIRAGMSSMLEEIKADPTHRLRRKFGARSGNGFQAHTDTIRIASRSIRPCSDSRPGTPGARRWIRRRRSFA